MGRRGYDRVSVLFHLINPERDILGVIFIPLVVMPTIKIE